jgi:hypothetical protein
MEFDEYTIERTKLIYLKYLAVKNYFNGKFNNYFKYNGKIRYNISDNIELKKEFYPCLSLGKKHKDLIDIEKVLVLNSFYSDNFFIRNVNESHLIELRKYKENGSYIFQQEVKQFFKDKDYNKRFNSTNEFKYSEVFSTYLNGEISVFTLISLNICTGFLDNINKRQSDIYFAPLYEKIKRLQNFLEMWEIFPILVFKKTIKEFLCS